MNRYFASIFTTAVLFLSADSVFASKIATSENKNVRPNVGVVTMPSVTVSDEPGMPRSLSGYTSFSLVISPESNVRFFRKSAFDITVTPNVARVYSVYDDLRTIRFQADAPLPAGTTFTISGIQVVAYNRYSPLHGFDLDLGSDGEIDAYDPNGIRVTDEYGTQDITIPQEVTALTGSFVGSTVTVSAQPSGDLDFENFRVVFLDASGKEIFNNSQASLVAKSFDLPAGTDVVRVQSVDRYGNVSIGSDLRKPSPAVTASGSTSTGSTATGATSTGSTATGATSTGTVSNTGSTASGAVALPVKYVPNYRHAPLSNVIAAMDRFIAAQTKNDALKETVAVRTIRNDLAKLFESFYQTRITAKKRLLVGQIRTKAALLKAELLK